METTKIQSIKVWVGCTLLAALTVVLQFIAGLIKIGTFSFTFVLIPIIVAAIFYGIKGGVIVGSTFGITVLVQAITGYDVSGAFLFELNPVFTIIITVVRAFLVGLFLALIYKALKNKNMYLKALILSIAAPVLNTGIFLILYSTLFNNVLITGAASKNVNVWYFVIFILVGINFIVELFTTVILCPPIVKALEKINKRI